MRLYFYEVNYQFADYNGDDHSFLIGYFSSLKKARSAVEAVEHKSGFCDTSGAFTTQKFAVSFHQKVQKEDVILYEVSHEYTDEDGYDVFIVLGVFGAYEEALAVKMQNENKFPYNQYPDGFLISECKADICGWQEGFVID